MPRLSVILSTYEKPDELRLALESLRRAATLGVTPFELVIADDGSGPETGKVIENFAKNVSFDVVHVRHDDEGFRLAKIRNAAIRKSTGDVLFFVDGDSLVVPEALRAHSEQCEPGTACAGTRFFLGERQTANVLGDAATMDDVLDLARRSGRWARRKLFVMNAVYRHTRLKTRPKLIGGNCSVHRSDLERINGFDERFIGWGREDDDLARRLRRSGVRVRDVCLDCLVVHLHHPPHPSHQPSVHHTPNYAYFHRDYFLARCVHGLETRRLEDVTFDLPGEFPVELAPLREKLGRPRSGEWAEVLGRPPGPVILQAVHGQFEAVIQLPRSVLESDSDPVTASLHHLSSSL